MSRKIELIVFLILAALCACQLVGPQPCGAQSDRETPTYVIGPNDVLSIYVWKEPELTRDVTVMPDGRITIPLAGEIMAQGQTATQLKKTVAEKLGKYVTAPEVTVIVRESRSQIIYTIGKVTRSGPYPLTSNMTVLQALSSAGGLTEWADTKNILIIRRQADRVVQIPFNYKEFTSGQNLEQNILLQAGDTVLVP